MKGLLLVLATSSLAWSAALGAGISVTGPRDVGYWNANFVAQMQGADGNKLFPNDADKKDAYWAGSGSVPFSCTGKLRVCRVGEADTANGKKICAPNKLGRATVSFEAQNWPGPQFNGWYVIPFAAVWGL